MYKENARVDKLTSNKFYKNYQNIYHKINQINYKNLLKIHI